MATTPPGTGTGPNPLDPLDLANYYRRLSAEREILDYVKAQSEFLRSQYHFRKDILENAKDLHRLQQQVRDIDEEDLGTYDIKLNLAITSFDGEIEFNYYQDGTHSILETNLEEKTEQSDVVQEPDITEQSDKDYVNVVKKVKKENITPDNISEIMLCQIPGISSVTALAIMEQYKNIPNLIKELETNIDFLKDITSTNSKGQTRKINKTSIANIVKFLLKK